MRDFSVAYILERLIKISTLLEYEYLVEFGSRPAKLGSFFTDRQMQEMGTVQLKKLVLKL